MTRRRSRSRRRFVRFQRSNPRIVFRGHSLQEQDRQAKVFKEKMAALDKTLEELKKSIDESDKKRQAQLAEYERTVSRVVFFAH